MKIELELAKFVDIITSPSPCLGVSIEAWPELIEQINQLDPEYKVCHIETSFGKTYIWSAWGWEQELAHREYLVKIHKERAVLKIEEKETPIVFTGHKTRAQIIKENKKKSKRDSALEDLLNNFGIKL